jgi:hypothetical protein
MRNNDLMTGHFFVAAKPEAQRKSGHLATKAL